MKNPTLSIQTMMTIISILLTSDGAAENYNCYTYGNYTNCQGQQGGMDSRVLQSLIDTGNPYKQQQLRQEQQLRQLQIEEMKLRLQRSNTLNQNQPYQPSGNQLPTTIAECDREYPPTQGNFRSQVRCYKSIDERNGPLSAEAESLYADWTNMALKTDNGEAVPKSDLDSLGVRYSAYITKKYGGAPTDDSSSSKEEKLDAAKAKCSSLGFKKGTVKHGDCVMRLLD
jgi:hypothetical protein